MNTNVRLRPSRVMADLAAVRGDVARAFDALHTAETAFARAGGRSTTAQWEAIVAARRTVELAVRALQRAEALSYNPTPGATRGEANRS